MTAGVARCRTDLHAVAPLVAATMAIIVLGRAAGAHEVAAVAWVVGSVSIGAAVMGHEVHHATLGLLLAQPVSRVRILLAKYLVAAAAIAATAATAAWARLPAVLSGDGWSAPVVVLLLVGTSLFVAPWLTMLMRSTLAGLAGTLVAPGVLAGVVTFAVPAGRVDTGPVFAGALAALCLSAAAAGTWVFTRRLEDRAAGGRAIHVRLAPAADAGDAPRRALWHLVSKELHLQQLPVVVAGLYAAASLGAWLAGSRVAPEVDPRAEQIVWIYGGSLALLVGAVASAEERHLGTLPSQLVLPMPLWRQFLLKTVIAVGLCVLLSALLPAALATSWDGPTRFELRPETTVFFAGLTMAGLYASSVSTSSLRALVLAPLLIAVLWPMTQLPAGLAGRVAYAVVGRVATGFPLPGLDYASLRWMTNTLGMATLGGLAGLVWLMALRNHRRVPPSWSGVARQCAIVVFYLSLMAGTAGAVTALLIPASLR